MQDCKAGLQKCHATAEFSATAWPWRAWYRVLLRSRCRSGSYQTGGSISPGITIGCHEHLRWRLYLMATPKQRKKVPILPDSGKAMAVASKIRRLVAHGSLGYCSRVARVRPFGVGLGRETKCTITGRDHNSVVKLLRVGIRSLKCVRLTMKQTWRTAIFRVALARLPLPTDRYARGLVS